MISFTRRLFAIVLMLGILGPATTAVCLQATARHCTTSQSSHDCCEGPRVSSCDCRISGATVPSEPAQRVGITVASVLSPILPIASAMVISTDRIGAFVDSSPPVLSGGDRLSLFSILLV